eukprot:7005866-Prymnesium_polylepis.1
MVAADATPSVPRRAARRPRGTLRVLVSLHVGTRFALRGGTALGLACVPATVTYEVLDTYGLGSGRGRFAAAGLRASVPATFR